MLPKIKGKFVVSNIFVWIAILAFCSMVWYWFGVWTDNNLEYWLSYAKHSNVSVNNALSMLISLLFNAVALVFNIISELIKLAL